MEKLKSIVVYIVLSLVSGSIYSGSIIFVNKTGTTIRIKIEDPEGRDYEEPFRIDLQNKEIFFLEKAKLYYNIAFSKIRIMDSQKLWAGKQYDNNIIPVSTEEDFLVILDSFGEREGNYLQIIFTEDEAKQYLEAVKGVPLINKEVSLWWKEIKQIQADKEPIESSIKRYISKVQAREGSVREKIKAWGEKLGALRQTFASGKYRIHNLNYKIQDKVRLIERAYRPSV